MATKGEMMIEVSTIKKFEYKKQDLSLNFSLMVDYPNDLSIFREFLLQALKDVDKELLRFARK